MNNPVYQDMPPKAPLRFDAQDLSTSPPGKSENVAGQGLAWRFATFLPAFIGTGFLIFGLYGWLSGKGMTGLEWALLTMIGATFVWVALSVSTVGVAIAGLLARAEADARAPDTVTGIDVALLIPIYNENPADVFGNAAAMLEDISRRSTPHRFSLFILSDSKDMAILEQERLAYLQLRAQAPSNIAVHYRQRPENTDKKVGNIAQWVEGWGATFDGMVVLDADSLMSGRAITRLASELSHDPKAGLIQTFPMLIGAHTLFARLQQFSNIAYGWLLAEGLALWSRHEGNYWGHNAIIRTRAFASSAGLPHLKGRNGADQLILSHDFVEAGLLRRAGWHVRFLPRVSGSFEETPATLIDYVLRDRRWCRGNLQHLRLLRTAGLHPVSRFHLFHGAVSYLLSPAWFLLLVVWALLGKDSETNVIRYFNETNPLFPDWPPAMSHIDSAVFLVIMYAMLLTPKIVGAAIITARPQIVRVFGGRYAFLGAFLVEVILSIAYAPILMIQQTRAVLRAMLGRSEPWAPQRRTASHYPWRTLFGFHWVETLIGMLLFVGLVSGLVSLWLVPIMLSLLLAVPLSALSAADISGLSAEPLRLDSPHTLREPSIAALARRQRAMVQARLDHAVKLPAE